MIQGKEHELRSVKIYGIKKRTYAWVELAFLKEQIDNKPRAKSQSKTYDDMLDSLWSKLVKMKDGNKCMKCEAKTNLNSHHVITRSNKRLRWDLNNGICLCALHHTLSQRFSAHKRPAEFQVWFDKRFPGRSEHLRTIANSKGQKTDKQLVYRYLKQQEAELR